MHYNPFKPSAGHTPPLLIGRDHDIEDFIEGLDNGPGSPTRLMRVTGARGIGKTVLLSEFARIARERKWEVIRENASKGLAARLLSRLQPAPRGRHEFTVKPTLQVGETAGSLGVYHYQSAEQMPLTLSEAMDRRIHELEKKGAGLLIAIDEAQAAERDDMIAISTAAQDMNINNRDYALVFAGLPSMSSKWLNEDATTFMRRADPHMLQDIPLDEVKRAFEDTFRESGMAISDTPLHMAVEATYGYPFMIQLVGYHIWSSARRNHPDTPTISVEDAKLGIGKALTRLGDTVHGPELDSLSPVDRTYLLAMAQDDGPSSTSMVAERMGKEKNYAGQYRARLLDAQVIEPKGYGLVDFAIPYLREYLREHAAYYRMNAESTD
ncbi:ATP-binding protein [Bifidobacterium leontopitheci]|uniref:AAA ATPase domain-containing protein n=1 Tax=Bifidobacterium leontopitheci TaxID=2650774 RepID=A0A6I1GIY4_9BIFI|nr:ATP-binding protein [Bifidobacterium leontopitheci]KAB7790682.1 AAA ATPase domain-containing protein [Bifidobacterium leontopitheci]